MHVQSQMKEKDIKKADIKDTSLGGILLRMRENWPVDRVGGGGE